MFAFSMNTSWSTSYPSSTWTPHTSMRHRSATWHAPPTVVGSRLAAGSFFVCRVEFVFPRRRPTHLFRKLRGPRWRLQMCVRSRALGQNSSSYCRASRGSLTLSPPNWLSNSPSFVKVPDETVAALVVCQGCTATFLANDDTACQ